MSDNISVLSGHGFGGQGLTPEVPRKHLQGCLSEHKEKFQDSLLHWYDKEHRILPWREDPTPYHVWISEIMLQQTRVEAVHGYYLRFIGRLPDVRSLADVSEEELNKLWEGLGYYSRARNLKKAAEIVVREYGGVLPASYDELLKLPGIGPYTAGAIASIAFHQSVPAVDGNVMRVIARLTGCGAETAIMRTKKEIEETVKSLIPEGKAHRFNQALMELGALICIPNGAPKCGQCPVGYLCYANEMNMQALFPVKKKKKDRKIEKRTVLIFVDRQGRILIQKRGESGLLAGMWEFPMFAGHLSEAELSQFLGQSGIAFERIERIAAVKHIFTHIEWHMEGFLVRVTSDFTTDISSDVALIRRERHWCGMEKLKRDYPVPTAFKKYLSAIENPVG